MKYISNHTIFDSWKTLIELGSASKGSLNRFFGMLELIKHLSILQNEGVLINQQYELNASELSGSLQSLYFFGKTTKSFSSDTIYVIFPKDWQKSVLQVLLKNKTLPIEAVSIVCMQRFEFDEEPSLENIVAAFRDSYHISVNEDVFFHSIQQAVEFDGEISDRMDLLNLFKDYLNSYDANKLTVGFSKEFFSKQAGELTAGPFIQPLYAGQENLKCLLISNFDLTTYYNIKSGLNKSKPIDASLKTEPRNKIIYGAPGTGKSYELRKQVAELGFSEDNSIRVTFHPNYSYQQFVGSYKPSPIYKSISSVEGLQLFGADKLIALQEPYNKEPLIDYTLIPGPFLIQLINSLKKPNENFLIIIEEINRANVSSVFGDVFQLLDRNEFGESEYDIEFNKDITSYLKVEGISKTKIRIPSNLFIWATMNSADQGVMPLDSAFKRRWSFEYLSIDAKESDISDRTMIFQEELYSWNKFRRSLNTRLKEIHISEDKLIGPFFLNHAELKDSKAIKNKLLLYLRDDVVRHNPDSLFEEKTFSDIVLAYTLNKEIFVGLNKGDWGLVSPEEKISEDLI